MSGSSLKHITIQGMRRFMIRSAELGKARPGGRTAVYVSSQIQYGMARMAEVFLEFEEMPFEFRIFQVKESAVKWLMENDR